MALWWRRSHNLTLTLLLLLSSQIWAANFTFTYGVATQCDNFEVSWTGGIAPYHLTIVPQYGTPKVMNIPAEAYTNNRGLFRTAMIHKAGVKVLAIMSDAGGFASGGVSPVITVRAQTGTTQCNTTEPSPAFFYDNPLSLTQCRPYQFVNYPQAKLPVLIKGVVPGGTSFILTPGANDTSFNWVANVAAGTQVVLYMQDAAGRQGGSTDFMSVGMSGDNSCLNAQSPISVTNAPSMTSTTSMTTSMTTSTQTRLSGAGRSDGPVATQALTPDKSKRLNTGRVIGIAVGAVGGAIMIGFLIWLCLRRGKRHTGRTLSPFPPSAHGPGTPETTVHLLGGRASLGDGARYPVGGASSLDFARPPNPIATSQSPLLISQPNSTHHHRNSSGYSGISAPPAPTAGYTRALMPEERGRESSSRGSRNVPQRPPGPSRMQRKAAQMGLPEPAPRFGSAHPTPTARVIVHTDIEDEFPPPLEENIIELPPRYSERRGRSSPVSVPVHQSRGMAIDGETMGAELNMGSDVRRDAVSTPLS